MGRSYRSIRLIMPKIFGKVRRLRSNNQEEYISTKVYIFEGRVRPFKRPNPQHDKLCYTVHDGYRPDKGFSTVDLPPGLYTVVLELDGQMYHNRYSQICQNCAEFSYRIWSPIRLNLTDLDVTPFLCDDRITNRYYAWLSSSISSTSLPPYVYVFQRARPKPIKVDSNFGSKEYALMPCSS